MSKIPKLLVFDSGIGGMTILRHIDMSDCGLGITYIADDVGFPYSDKTIDFLYDHLKTTLDRLIIDHAPDGLVVACNTASTIIQSYLRDTYPDMAITVIVPGVKVICEQSDTHTASVIATPLTVAQDRIKNLIQQFGEGKRITTLGTPRLSRIVEQYIDTGHVDEDEVLGEIQGAFVDDMTGKTDYIALGCTHYPLLIPVLDKVAPWPVVWVDPAQAVARHTLTLLGEKHSLHSGVSSINFGYTSGAHNERLVSVYSAITKKYPIPAN